MSKESNNSDLICAGSVKNMHTEIPGEISDDKTEYEFPTIESVTSSGKVQYWTLIVKLFKAKYEKALLKGEDINFCKIKSSYFDFGSEIDENRCGCIITVYKIGEEGKISDIKPIVIKSGKNLGKKNATNAFSQAVLEAYSRYRKRLKSAKGKPVQTKVAGVQMHPPMAGKLLDKYKGGIIDFADDKKYYVQRKYDGVRLVSTPIVKDGKVVDVLLYSRFCREYTQMHHLKKDLIAFFGCVLTKFDSEDPDKYLIHLDGEFYTHGTKLQDISGISRRELERSKDDEDGDLIDYHVFDIFWIDNEDNLSNHKFDERKSVLDSYFDECSGDLKYVYLAPSEEVHSMDEINQKYEEYLAEDYEGAIVRLPLPYKFSHNNYRSNGILKVKPEYDDEFKVVGYTTGKTGKAKGVLIFEFETKEGKVFKSSLKNISNDESKALYKKMSEPSDDDKTYFESKYLGKKLTVSYQDLSKDGKPVRAHVISLEPRDYE